jgi:hypothetical protein
MNKNIISTEPADYLVFVGKDRNTSRPEASAYSIKEACDKADQYIKADNYVQVVYMPEDTDDTETVLEIINGVQYIGGAN